MTNISPSSTVYKLKTKDIYRMSRDHVHYDSENGHHYITEGMYILDQSMTDQEYLVRRKLLTEDEEEFYAEFYDDDEMELFETEEHHVFERWMIDSLEVYVTEAMDIEDIINML